MKDQIKLLFIFGTRPEAIKLAPLILEFRKHTAFSTRVCVTAQHREMLDQVLDFFSIIPDDDLNLMKHGQSLTDITANTLVALEKVISEYHPHLVFTQGDTTTSFTGALAAYYCKVKVAHIEAGLRSQSRYAPFPEEMNRVLADHLSDYHFTPTLSAGENLQKENIVQHNYPVGNTVIDALFSGLEIIRARGEHAYAGFFAKINFSRRIVLVTGHRRESFGKPFENICMAIREAAAKFSDVEFVYPVHLNPNVAGPVNRLLGGIENIHLYPPLDYDRFIWLMSKSHLVLTDSGGLQEEAPSLGKPVLVMREVTERKEGIEAGNAMLVGTEKEKIFAALDSLLTDVSAYEKMSGSVNPYGDGKSSARIVEIISKLMD